MHLSKIEMLDGFNLWLNAWDEHNLEGVMEFMHEEVVFENWDGMIVSGKSALQKLWLPLFIFNNNFKFIAEDVFIDEEAQKISFQWRYEGLTFEKEFKGKEESRRGVDMIHFLEGKIIKKSSYSKTGIQIDSQPVLLSASK